MASFSVRADGITIQVRITGTAGYYRVFWRPTSTSTADEIDAYSGTWFDITTYMGSELEPDTEYVVNVRDDPGTGNLIGAKTIRTGSNGPARPQNWTWWSVIERDRPINISAAEWNAFTERIDEFCEYKGQHPSYCTTVSSGWDISAWVVNQAVNAINSLGGYISQVQKDDPITASFFHNLASELNSIP